MRYTVNLDYVSDAGNYLAQDTPERLLWVAVIQRAVEDYARYFQVLAHSYNESKAERSQRLKTDKNHGFLIRAGIDLRHLYNFIFRKEARPFNLSYIQDVCDFPDGYIERVRYLCEVHFTKSLQWARQQEFHPAVLDLAKHAVITTDAELASLETTTPEIPRKGRPPLQSAPTH